MVIQHNFSVKADRIIAAAHRIVTRSRKLLQATDAVVGRPPKKRRGDVPTATTKRDGKAPKRDGRAE